LGKKIAFVFSVLLLTLVGTQNAFAMTFDVDSSGDLPEITDMTFTITASGEACNIVDIDARLAIQHTWVGDFIITLESPSSTLVSLVDQPDNPPDTFGSALDDFPDVILDDSAVKPIETPDNGGGGQAYFEGDSYTPNGALSDFNGEDPNGVWNLRVQDINSGDMGFLYKAGETAPWGTAIGTQLIITPEANCDMTMAVGGEFIPLDTTMILVAGAQSSAAWMIPVIVSAIGIGIVIARKF